jgi:uncharacterized protein (TIGR03435 family)
MGSSLIQTFKDELKGFEMSKGTIRFPVDKPPSAVLVNKLVKARSLRTRSRRRAERIPLRTSSLLEKRWAGPASRGCCRIGALVLRSSRSRLRRRKLVTSGMQFTGAILACIVACQALVAQSAAAFDVASIRPSPPGVHPLDCNTLPGGVFACHNVRIEGLFRMAFGFKFSTIKGAPPWFDELYDVNAKAEGAGEMTQAELATPLLALFRERFGLVVHEEAIKETVYVLEQQTTGAKLKPSSPGTALSAKGDDEAWLYKGETMRAFAASLATMPDIKARVIDNTGLVGQFDFALPYINAGGNGGAPVDPGVAPVIARRSAAAYSSIFDALLSIGLRLREEKRDTTALVIDQIHRPSEN